MRSLEATIDVTCVVKNLPPKDHVPRHATLGFRGLGARCRIRKRNRENHPRLVYYYCSHRSHPFLSARLPARKERCSSCFCRFLENPFSAVLCRRQRRFFRDPVYPVFHRTGSSLFQGEKVAACQRRVWMKVKEKEKTAGREGKKKRSALSSIWRSTPRHDRPRDPQDRFFFFWKRSNLIYEIDSFDGRPGSRWLLGPRDARPLPPRGRETNVPQGGIIISDIRSTFLSSTPVAPCLTGEERLSISSAESRRTNRAT